MQSVVNKYSYKHYKLATVGQVEKVKFNKHK